MLEKYNVTELLVAWNNGDKGALDKLVPKVYRELRKLAAIRLHGEQINHSLQVTGLINEVYLKLVNINNITWKNRAHFFGVTAQLMRNILVDHARNIKAEKRGGQNVNVTLTDILDIPEKKDLNLIALDEALKELERFDPQQSRIIELRFFGGLTIEETAEVIGISSGTVKREWNMARSWLYKQINSAI